MPGLRHLNDNMLSAVSLKRPKPKPKVENNPYCLLPSGTPGSQKERCIPGDIFQEFMVYELNHRGFINRSFVELRPMTEEDVKTWLHERVESNRQNSDCKGATMPGMKHLNNDNMSSAVSLKRPKVENNPYCLLPSGTPGSQKIVSKDYSPFKQSTSCKVTPDLDIIGVDIGNDELAANTSPPMCQSPTL